MHKLVRLRDEDIKALVRFNEIKSKNHWKKEQYLKSLREWLAAHPDEQLAIPKLPGGYPHSQPNGADRDTDKQAANRKPTRGRSGSTPPLQTHGQMAQSELAGTEQAENGHRKSSNAMRDDRHG